jgi:hypothetical protein
MTAELVPEPQVQVQEGQQEGRKSAEDTRGGDRDEECKTASFCRESEWPQGSSAKIR